MISEQRSTMSDSYTAGPETNDNATALSNPVENSELTDVVELPVMVDRNTGEVVNEHSIDMLKLPANNLSTVANLMGARIEYRKFRAVYTPVDGMCPEKGCWQMTHDASVPHSRISFEEAYRRGTH